MLQVPQKAMAQPAWERNPVPRLALQCADHSEQDERYTVRCLCNVSLRTLHGMAISVSCCMELMGYCCAYTTKQPEEQAVSSVQTSMILWS